MQGGADVSGKEQAAGIDGMPLGQIIEMLCWRCQEQF